MNRHLKSALVVALGLAATCAWAQAPAPPQNTTPPSSTSSPGPRDSSSSTAETPPANGAEPSSASSPHQRQATAGSKAEHDQMMKDCIAKEQANSASTTAAQAKKTCKEQMKSNASQPKKY
jgi:hypothetical protein